MKTITAAAAAALLLTGAASVRAAPAASNSPAAVVAAPTTTAAPVTTREDAAGLNANGNVQQLNNAQLDEHQAAPFHINPDESPEGGTGGVPAGAAPPR